jgi:hypothetical protein
VGIVGVLALAAGWMIWRDRSTPGPTTTLLAAPTTTPEPSTTVAISTTVETSTAATTEEQREAEVEQILTDLWFGWFDAIYRKDPDALWEVVATTTKYDAAVAAMDNLTFLASPDAPSLNVQVLDILLDREDCLVAQSVTEAPFLTGSPSSESVQVLWPDPLRGWRFATSWVYAADLWQADCDDVARETTP